MLEFRTVGAMTAQTVQGQIRIPRIDNFGADRVRRVGLPVVALPTEVDIRRLGHEERIVRAVRGVADTALTIGNRLMFGDRALLACDGVTVTAVADLLLRRPQQLRLRRGVWRVTVQTSDLIDDRPVNAILVEGFVNRLVMTALAQLNAYLQGSKWLRRSRFYVTLFAHPVAQRCMHIIVQHRGCARTMWIMAG